MLQTFAIGVGLNLGSALLGSLFGGGNKQPWTQREINKLETFDQPQSRYGEPIPEFYGRVRVQGIYVAAQIPFDWERDDYRNGQTREVELTYIYYGNLGVMWGIAPLQANINIQKIYFNKQVLIAGGNIDGILGEYWGRFEGLSTSDYSGGQTTPDPKLSFLGENHTAFRGSMYTAMKRLRLNNSDGGLFDFRYPNLEAEIVTHDQGASFTLADVVANLLQKAGYVQAEYDVSELASIECRGFISTVGRLADKLGKLQSAYFFEIVDTGAKLKFIKAFRPSSSAYIPATDLGTSDGDRLGELFTETEEDPASLPTSFRVYFNDYGNNYQPNSKESFKIKLGDWENVEEIETGLTLTETEAYTIANRLLLLAWTRRKTYKSFIPPKYQSLEGGDVIDVELRAGTATPLQIKRLNQSPSGVIEIEAIAYDGSIFDLGYTAPAAITSTATATQGTAINLGQANIYAVNSVTDITGGTIYVLGTDYTVNTSTGTITPIIGGGISNGSEVVVNWQGESEPSPAPSLTPIPTTLAAIDIVKPSAIDSTGLYLFADGDAPWQSATLWESSDGTNYTSAGPIYRGIFGTANNTLPDGSGEDLVSTLSVTVTETMTFPASGRLLVGDEILDYAAAALASSTPTSKTYTLSEFNRALRDTDGTGHGGSESVYLLSGYKFVSPVDAADIGSTRYFKAVSPGQGLADVSAVSIVITGNSLSDEGVFFADIQGFARDNADLESEIEDLETAIAAKENTITPGTTGQYWRGDKTFQTLDKNAVGLGNVNNTSDADKPISTATQTALNSKFNNPTGTTAQYIRGDGSLATFPTPSTNTFGSVYVASPTNTTIIKIPAGVGYTINALKGVAVDAGTCTLAIKINGVAVTGLGAIAVTTTPQNINATAANIVADGALLTWEFSSVSGATGFRGSLSVSI